jgi:hypothetical protein
MPLLHRRGFLIGMPLALAACGAKSVWAPDDVVARAAHVHDGPSRLTLFTMKNVDTGYGAHTSLMINASQRVIFDPAGSLVHPEIPERNDVLFGITPRVEEFYISYHARTTYYVTIQAVDVPAGTSEQALRLALAYGPVPRSFCTNATSRILSQLPGFEVVNVTFLPDRLLNQFAKLPGVTTQERRDTDPDDDRSAEIQRFEAASQAAVAD